MKRVSARGDVRVHSSKVIDEGCEMGCECGRG